MSQPDQSRDPVATAQDLTRALGGMAEEVRRLRSYGRHNRAFVAVDVLLTILLSAFGYLSVHAAQSASQANSAQLALCRAGNVSRAQQIGVWDYLLKLAGPPKTARAAKLDAQFIHHLHVIYAPRDCSRLGR